MLLIIALFVICKSDEAFYQWNFNQGLNGWGGRFSSTNHSAILVDCPTLVGVKCMTLTKKAEGGDIFSNAIPIRNTETIIVEFKYLQKSATSRSTYSALISGWTDQSTSKFCWAANGNPFNGLNDRTAIQPGGFCDYPTYKSVQIQDLSNNWKTIKYSILPQQLDKLDSIRLVFEDYNNIDTTPGAYYITDIVMSYEGQCSNGCADCITFYECSSCKGGYSYLGGRCYEVQCGNSLTQGVPYQRVSLEHSKAAQFVKSVVTIPNYSFVNCWPSQWVTLEHTTGKFTELNHFIDPSNLNQAILVITPQNITQMACIGSQSNIFICQFHFNIHYNEQTMYQQNYTLTIDFSSISKPIESNIQELTTNLSPLLIAIESKIEYCSNYNDCIFTSTDQLKVVLNQLFKVKLTLIGDNFKTWKLEQGQVRLFGNGTNAPFDITNFDDSVPGVIIYSVKANIMAYNGTGLLVTAKAVNPANSNGRLLQQSNINSGHANSNITNILFNKRELVYEDDPEYSGILISLVLILLWN